MKFDSKTLEVLKNFASINPSIKFVKGDVIKTMSPIKTIIGKAKVTSEITQDFCIGELSRFMSSLSLFNDPEIVLEDTKCTITDGKNKIEYVYTAEESIKLPPKNDLTLPSNDVQFTLTNEMFQSIRKAMSVLSLAEMAVVGKDGVLSLKAFDSKGVTKDQYSIEIGETNKNFIIVYKAENLKLMPLDYEVSISAKGISVFKNPEIEYVIVIEANESNFDGEKKAK